MSSTLSQTEVGQRTPSDETIPPEITKRVLLTTKEHACELPNRWLNPETPAPAEPAPVHYPYPGPASDEDEAPAHAALHNARSR